MFRAKADRLFDVSLAAPKTGKELRAWASATRKLAESSYEAFCHALPLIKDMTNTQVVFWLAAVTTSITSALFSLLAEGTLSGRHLLEHFIQSECPTSLPFDIDPSAYTTIRNVLFAKGLITGNFSFSARCCCCK